MLRQGCICKRCVLIPSFGSVYALENRNLLQGMARGVSRKAKKKNSSANLFNPLKAKLKIAKDKLEASEATVAELRAARSPYDVIVQTAVEVCV